MAVLLLGIEIWKLFCFRFNVLLFTALFERTVERVTWVGRFLPFLIIL